MVVRGPGHTVGALCSVHLVHLASQEGAVRPPALHPENSGETCKLRCMRKGDSCSLIVSGRYTLDGGSTPPFSKAATH